MELELIEKQKKMNKERLNNIYKDNEATKIMYEDILRQIEEEEMRLKQVEMKMNESDKMAMNDRLYQQQRDKMERECKQKMLSLYLFYI